MYVCMAVWMYVWVYVCKFVCVCVVFIYTPHDPAYAFTRTLVFFIINIYHFGVCVCVCFFVLCSCVCVCVFLIYFLVCLKMFSCVCFCLRFGCFLWFHVALREELIFFHCLIICLEMGKLGENMNTIRLLNRLNKKKWFVSNVCRN